MYLILYLIPIYKNKIMIRIMLGDSVTNKIGAPIPDNITIFPLNTIDPKGS